MNRGPAKKEVRGRVSLSVEAFEAGLSPLAQRSAGSRGRERPEESCGLRTPYQRDRDRIVHAKAFRRLKHKTQVFIDPEGDHFRTRLTHTLETAGISRTVARALRLNEDLTEAVALGHDLGHTPFGHAGEDALHEAVRRLGDDRGFRHNEQSLRVVELVENGGAGLNLTWETRDGILRHTGPELPATLEGRIVKICDRVAYVNHDIDDALRAGLLSESQLPSEPIALLGCTSSERIDTLVHDLVDESEAAGDIRQSAPVGAAMDELRTFLFQRVYARSIQGASAVWVRRVVAELVGYFAAHPEEVPELPAGGLRAAVDYVAGMTDRYAERVWRQIQAR